MKPLHRVSAQLIACFVALAGCVGAGASTIQTFHDPNANGVAAGATTSVCSGFFSITIDYTISNEGMEDPYTIDWKTVPFRVTNVTPFATRKTSIQTYKSCPEVNGSVDWIDEGPLAPARGTQTFPAPHHQPGFVLLNALSELLSLVDELGPTPTLASVYSMDGVDVMSFVSAATPLNAGDLMGQWHYTFSASNLDDVPHMISNTLFAGLNGSLLAGETRIVEFDGRRPAFIGPGSLSLLDTGDIFPIVGITAVPEPASWLLLAAGLAALRWRRLRS